MSLSIPGDRLILQEGLPQHEDLAPENLSWLTVALSDPKFLRPAHDMAEATSLVYRESHPALRVAATRLPGEDNAKIARIVSHGAAALEAACRIANPTSMPDWNVHYVVLNAHNLSCAEGNGLIGALEDAAEELRADRPRLAVAVYEAVDRHYPGMGNYAMLGAGIMYQLELAAV